MKARLPLTSSCCSPDGRTMPRSRDQMSLLATVAQAISAPEEVDITAARAAASTSPRTPMGSSSLTMVAKASSGLASFG
ncbi:hypothetical protein SGRIM128S_08666 [Streptomyces griseomycini]